jgi:hypothetical protein
MLRVGFESMTQVFQRVKTGHISDCTATVIGPFHTVYTRRIPDLLPRTNLELC